VLFSVLSVKLCVSALIMVIKLLIHKREPKKGLEKRGANICCRSCVSSHPPIAETGILIFNMKLVIFLSPKATKQICVLNISVS